MADEIDEIRARINIVDLVGQSVALKKAGNSFKGLCPFHQDHNPSFSVTPNTGRYKCWSCGEGGDIFTWVQKTRNVEFAEALQILAEMAGVQLHRQKGQDRSVRLNQRSAMETALALFRECLGQSKAAQDYCAGRGLGQDLLDKWEVGFAPDDGQALTVTLQKKGFRLADCKALFLVDGDESQGYFDKFRGRLMFPIREERGDLVAFGGRVLGDGMPKYINSGDTPLYKKSKVLYGMNVAKETMRTARQAVLVEGYLDVIACHAAGASSAVASLGTALSEDHAKLLRRWCDSTIILYDSDAAGQKASARAWQILLAEGLQVRIAAVPEGKDPDTLLRSAGPEAVRAAASSGLSPLEYQILSIERAHAPESDEFWKLVVETLAAEDSELERARFVQDLAPRYPKINDAVAARKALRDQIDHVRARRSHAETAVVRTNAFGYMEENIERSLHPYEITLFRAILEPEYRSDLWVLLGKEDLFLTSNGRKLAGKLLASFPEGAPEGKASDWVGRIESEGAKNVLAGVERDSRMILSKAVVFDAIEALNRKFREREVQALKAGGETDRLQKIQERLQQLKSGS